MESLTQFSKKLSKWFTLVVVIWAVFNYFLPTTSSWVYSQYVLLVRYYFVRNGADFDY